MRRWILNANLHNPAKVLNAARANPFCLFAA
jgi:hypothetical protein